jgi:competence protein ComEA
MLGLAAVGAASTLAGAGISIALPRASAAPSVSGVWLAPDPPGSSPAPAAANAVPAPTADAPDDPNGRAEVSPNSSGLTPDGKVILNVATADELKKLPRVGSKRAQAILDLRHKVGRFQRPTDLLRVHGIGRKTLKLMLPLLVLDPPGAK